MLILVADPDPVFRDSAARRLGGFEVVDRVLVLETLEEVLESLSELSPDLVLLSTALLDWGSVPAEQLSALTETCRVALVPLHSDPAYDAFAEAVGAIGTIAKERWHAELDALLHAVGGPDDTDGGGPAPGKRA